MCAMRARTPFLFCCVLFVLIAASAQSAEAATIAPVTIAADTEWTVGQSPIEILAPLIVSPGATLTIDPGVVVKMFANPRGLAAIEVDGTLDAGTPGEAEVTFTSIADDSIGGDTNGDGASTDPEQNRWGALQFTGASATSTLEHVRFRYAGVTGDVNSTTLSVQGSYAYVENVYTLTGARVLISHSTFENVPGYQVYMGSQGLLDLENDLFQGENYIARLWTSSGLSPTTLIMHQSSMNGLRGAALDYRLGTFSVHIENNWWGDPAGPYWAALNPSGTVNVGFNEPTVVSVLPFLICDPFASGCGAPQGSNILFLPGLEGSKLYENVGGSEKQLWDLQLGSSQQQAKDLYLNPDGTSVKSVYTKAGAALAKVDLPLSPIPFTLLDVYQTFFAKLASLKTGGTINDYLIFPYDWRMSPDSVVNNGTPYNDGKHYPDTELIALAASSQTGKVTIVGHSNGGLVAKALMEKLASEGKADLVDKVILVDVPQLGTTKAVGSMLNGDFNPYPGFMLSAANLRGLGENMPDAYDLLPSSAYFSAVADPVIDLSAAPQLRATAGITTNTITTPLEFASFITGGGGRAKPAYSDIATPDVLSSPLLANAVGLHTNLDAWVPPAGVEVVQVAGWGKDTPKTINYVEKQMNACTSGACGPKTVLTHNVSTTEDGDDTVVTASQSATTSWPTYYVDLQTSNHDLHTNLDHTNITETKPFQDLLPLLISASTSPTLPQYVSTTLPASSASDKRLHITLHSPVSLDAHDTQGRHTGTVANPTSDLLYIEEQIPNSSYQEFGEEKYLSIPDDGASTIRLHGLDTGTFTLDIASVSGDTTTGSTSYQDIPVTASTTAVLTVSPGDAASSSLALDINGDGSTDTVLASTTASANPLAYVRLIEATIASMDMGTSTKRQLVAKFGNVENLILRSKKWDSSDDDNDVRDSKKGERIEARILRKLAKIDEYVTRQVAKPTRKRATGERISDTQAAAILNMNAYLKTLIK